MVVLYFSIRQREVKMKKILILVLLLTALVFPLAAKTNLLNFGYNVQGAWLGIDDLKMRAIGLDYIHLGGDKTGFYFQFNPYFGTSFKFGSGEPVKFSDYDEQVFGSNFIFGFGGDLNFGPFGLILGGGLFLDLNYYNWPSSYVFYVSSGLGAGANFYFQPGDGTFIINAGLTGSWRPLYFWTDEFDSESGTISNQSNFNFNIGIGWRTGGVGSRSKSTSSSGGSGGGNDDDW